MSAKEPLPPVRGERVSERRARTAEILRRLHQSYPDSRTALTWRSPFELLVATILSAQTTDERVNMATPALFAAYPDPASLAQADLEHVQQLVQSTGFFRQKARNIQATSQRLVDTFGGEVPRTIPELVTLPGVARKTANVVISNCFPEHAAGIAVDTHVQRVARRLGWTRRWDPVHVEGDLVKLVPREEWNHVTHLLIDHGRATCKAPTPRCDSCPVADLCPAAERWLGIRWQPR